MSTSEDQGVTLNEMLQQALNAEQRGVAIDWKGMTFKVANLATNYIANLEPKQEELLEDE